MRITKLLLFGIITLLSACASTAPHDQPSRQAQLNAKYIGGDLYRTGRYIRHHPEWHRHVPADVKM